MEQLIAIGDSCLRLSSKNYRWQSLTDNCQKFISPFRPNPDLEIIVSKKKLTPLKLTKKVSKSEIAGGLICNWQKKENSIELRVSLPKRTKYLAAFLTLDLSSGLPRKATIELDCHILANSNIYPLFFPIEQIVFNLIYTANKTLLTHALGIVKNNCGYLFLGHSGAGKSTQGKFLLNNKEVIILNDDRIALKKKEDKYFIYGTPWPGELGLAENASAAIEAIYILGQGTNFSFQQLTGIAAAEAIISRVFISDLLPDALAKNMQVVEEIIVDKLPVISLTMPKNFTLLEALAEIQK